MDRRDFLTHLGGAAAAALSSSRLEAMTQAARREVRLNGRRLITVDVHGHCVFPEMAEMIAGTPVDRPFPDWQALGPARLTEMNARGIDYQVLSINRYWWYPAERSFAARIVASHDEKLAAWCEKHQDRFVALSSVALQFPDLAAEQLERAVKELGARGASIGGHVLGEVPSSERFDPFWERAAALGVPVFVHPHGAVNVVREGGLAGRGDLGNIVGNPLETAVFLSRMIYDGTLDRHPNLKVVGAHGGGYLPSYLGRAEVACEVRERADCLNSRRPSEYLKSQILADSMVFTEEGLRHLVAVMGASQVVYGTDIPYRWPDTLDLILDAPSLSDAEKEAILGGNLVGLLRIET